jgi:SAM-dependent methyltransferase
MKVENWMDQEDPFLKKREIEIHHNYHENLADKEVSLSKLFESDQRKIRIDSLNYFINKTGVKFHGKILEVGAGDGWCSAYIGRNFSYDELYTMEINKAAIERLIPKVFKVAEIDTSKSTLVLGSFNNIKLKNYFDVVVVMGALHHSSNLYSTFKSIYESLKPGGWLVAQEPSMHNDTLNNFYFEREKQEVNFKKLETVKNSDRSDVFYRECEYRTAGFHVGFDFYSADLSNQNTKKSFFDFMKKKEMKVVDKSRPANILIYAQKPLNANSFPVTNWEENFKNQK